MNTSSRPARRLVAALRAIAALVVLLALLAGLPALLWLFTTTLLPHGVSASELSGLLTQHENVGAPFLACLIAVGWIGWAVFVLSVLMEIPSQLSGRPAMRLPTLGAPQRLAALLVGAVLVALPTGTALAAPTNAAAATARPLVAAAPVTPTSTTTTAPVTSGSASTATAAGTSADHPQYRVQDRDSLWDIAQHHLGDGTHWKEIAQLNHGRTMIDGTKFNADDIQPGWILLLPTDATGPHLTGQQNTPPISASISTPAVTVTSAGESPWDLAVRYLGDGQRWADIAALNPQIPHLSATQPLPPGAIVTLPADAPTTSSATTTPVPQQAQQPTSDRAVAPSQEHVTVHAGDSLWSIAGTEYGDPGKWPQLFDANKGEEQPGGGHFTNPDLIIPGQQLTIPSANPAPTGTESLPPAPAIPAPATGPSQNQQPQQRQDQAAAPTQTPSAQAPSATASQSPNAPETSRSASPEASAPTAAVSVPAPEATRATQAVRESFLAPAEVWIGAGALAAAVISALTFRRRLQQRRVRPGRHIPLPTGRAAATEQSLRAAEQPAGFELLSRSLRTLALHTKASGRQLPVIEAVVLSDNRVVLHLSEPTVAVRPFTADTARADLWTYQASWQDLASDEDLADTVIPYPTLASIGWDTKQHLVLVDLEHIGVLQLAGDATFARHVLQAIAVELATGPLPGYLEVTAVAGSAPGLEAAAPDRVARTADVSDAADVLIAHTSGQRRALATIGAGSPKAARLTDEAGDSWTPHIAFAGDLPADSPQAGQLLAAIAEQPPVAAAVVITGEHPASDGWTLACSADESVVLPGSGLVVRLQGLSDEHYADAVDILALSTATTDVPAPAWITGTPQDTEQPSSGDGDGFALPAMYADMEQQTMLEAGLPGGLEEPVRGTGEAGSGPDEASGLSLADVLAEADAPTPERGGPVQQDAGREQPAEAGPSSATASAEESTDPVPAVYSAQPPVVPAPPRPGAAPKPAPEPDLADGPSVLLLGQVSLEQAAGRVDSNRRRPAFELISFLALNPQGVDHRALDEALRPGQRVTKTARDANISRARAWLGTSPDGAAYLPLLQDTGDGLYRLAPAVSCDWVMFQKHTRFGFADEGEDGDLALRRALALVRGRPFSGVDPGRYSWAEPYVEGMISEITHASYVLSTRRLEAGDSFGALWAAKQGLLAGEENEILHRCVFRAHHAAGDMAALRASAAALAAINQRLDDADMEAETAALLHELLPRPVVRR